MTQNLASRAVQTLAAVSQIGDDMASDHPMRHTVRKLKRTAEYAMDEAFTIANDLADQAEQIIKDYNKATTKGQKCE